MTLLQLRGVTRTVELPDAEPLHILRGVDLDVEVGDHVSIVGRSGSGKSTLLNLLGLLDTPTSGQLIFDGVPLEKLTGGERDRRRGADVGFIFQQFDLLGGRTALENVMTPLLYATGRQFWRRERIATEMLEKVGLGERLASMPEQLSGGEQQRVAIARAVANAPLVSQYLVEIENLRAIGEKLFKKVRRIGIKIRRTAIVKRADRLKKKFGEATDTAVATAGKVPPTTSVCS